MPFQQLAETAWEHARRLVAPRGDDPATEGEIAQAANALLNKAEDGPAGEDKLTKTDRRVAGRTRAATQGAWHRAKLPCDEPAPPAGDIGDGEDGETLAEVIPLGIFDPFAEAKKPW